MLQAQKGRAAPSNLCVAARVNKAHAADADDRGKRIGGAAGRPHLPVAACPAPEAGGPCSAAADAPIPRTAAPLPPKTPASVSRFKTVLRGSTQLKSQVEGRLPAFPFPSILTTSLTPAQASPQPPVLQLRCLMAGRATSPVAGSGARLHLGVKEQLARRQRGCQGMQRQDQLQSHAAVGDSREAPGRVWKNVQRMGGGGQRQCMQPG